MKALQQQVVGDQFLAIGMQHRGNPAEQGFHLWLGLQGKGARHGNGLGRRTGWDHVVRGNRAAGPFPEQVEQPLLLLFAPEIALVQHQHQPLAQGRKRLKNLHLCSA